MIRYWCQRQYGRLCVGTIIAVYVLITAGGIVRSLGAGMGCPDWPKCYGKWVPPTYAKDLPTDYRAQYYAARRAKNLRLATVLKHIGLARVATNIEREAIIFRSEHFSALKAWAEYINRLIGLCVGLLVLVTGCCAAFGYLGTVQYRIFWLMLAAGLGVLVAALLGAVVVTTHLLPFTITLHMAVAFLVIAALVLAYAQSRRVRGVACLPAPRGLYVWLWGLGLVFLVQVFLGTQLREGVDQLLAKALPREQLLEGLGSLFYLHRSSAWLLLLGQLGLCYWLSRRRAVLNLQRLARILATIYILEALIGASMYYFHIPAALQPVHLVLAFVAFGLQLTMLVESKQVNPTITHA